MTRARQFTGLVSIHIKKTLPAEENERYAHVFSASSCSPVDIVQAIEEEDGDFGTVDSDFAATLELEIPPNQIWGMVSSAEGWRFVICLLMPNSTETIVFIHNFAPIRAEHARNAFLEHLLNVCEWAMSTDRPDWCAFGLEKKTEILQAHLRE